MSVVPDRGNPTTNTGKFALQPKAADALEEIRRAECDHPGDEQFVLFRIVLQATLAPLGELHRVGPSKVFSGFGILTPRVQDLGQAEVQQQSLCVRQLRFLQQTCQRCAARSFSGSLPPRSSANL